MLNNVFIIGGVGGYDSSPVPDVLKLHKDNGKWEKVGELKIPRYNHAVALMP